MNKYNVGDKVVFTVTAVVDLGWYAFNDKFYFLIQSVDDYTEPLTNYTEPLERKIKNKQKQIEKLVDRLHRQAAEITRLLAENKRLKAENIKMSVKIDAYELCGDQHEVEYNQAFNKGAEAAWELARKGMLMSSTDREAIFGSGCNAMYGVLVYHTYPEAAAKVAQWEKAKEEIKVGDEVERNDLRDVKFIVTFTNGKLMSGVSKSGLVFSNENPKNWHKTGYYVDNILKKIGGK